MKNRKPLSAALRIVSWVIVLLPLVTAAEAHAQEITPPEPRVAAIPVAAIALEASTLEGFLRGVEHDLEVPPALDQIADNLPAADAALLDLSRKTAEVLKRGYDRGDLESLDAAWRSHRHDLAAWESSLSIRLTNLDSHRSQLIEREAIWKGTAAAAIEERAPGEVRTQVSQAQNSIESTSRALRKRRDEALGLQKRVVGLQARVNVGRDTLARARNEMLSQVFSRNGSPIWQVAVKTELSVAREDLVAASEETLERISDYARRSSRLIWMHLIWIAFVVWAGSMARTWMARPPLSGSRPVPDALSRPIAAGLVLGISASMWIYAEAPPKLGWMLSLFVLPFLYIVLRSLLPAGFKGPMIGLVSVVLLDLGRRVLMDFDALSHLLLVLEASIGLTGLIWLRRPGRLAEIPRSQNLFWVRVLGLWLHLSFFGAAISLVGSIFGWTAVADLLLSALVMGTFVGAVLFTATRVLEAIAEASAYSGKLDSLRILRNHRRTSLILLSRFARFIAFATWLASVLDNLGLEDDARNAAATILDAPIGYGSVQLTLGGLGAFAIAIWVSWLFARFIATALDEEIFSRVSLPRGVPFALSTITRYTILVLGFITAIAILGFDVSNLALLLSALGVGIGFGMQNVVNNFISGLILLFERPIKVGDLVSLDELLGTVDRIGIRSSTIRSFEGADVIVPNGDLISNRVTNWTLSDTRRRVSFPVGVAYGTPARRVIELLEQVANAHPEILDYPAPVGLFRAFGDSSLDFELRAWTESADALTTVRSDVAVAIQEDLAAAGIEVPFPQRDVYLKDEKLKDEKVKDGELGEEKTRPDETQS